MKIQIFLIAIATLIGSSLIMTGISGCQAPQNSKSESVPKKEEVVEPVEFGELENVLDEKALAWVEEQNAESKKRLTSDQLYKDLKSDILKIIQAKDRTPAISIRTVGTEVKVRNFWQDENHVRGIIREQSLADYKNKSSNWVTLVDIDAIATKEKEEWVYAGMDCAPKNEDRCLLSLSRGGGDASVTREYDLKTKDFVAGGFQLPEGKNSVSWLDDDRLWVGVDQGADSVSNSGYPITLKLWKRGDDLAKQPVLFKGDKKDLSVNAYTLRELTTNGERTIDLLSRGLTFFEEERYLNMPSGNWQRLPLPLDANILGLAQGTLLFSLRSAGTVFGEAAQPGAVYAFDIENLRGGKPVKLETVFVPSATQALEEVGITRDQVLISYLDNVRGRLISASRKDGVWTASQMAIPGDKGEVNIAFTNYKESLFNFFYSDPLTPSSMFIGGDGAKPTLVRQSPARFDATGMKVEAKSAKSKDGTKVPYFLITPKGITNANRKSGKVPTLINAYGGFEIAETPGYMGIAGKVWLERGGAYVIANIRGGGEFGPAWHQAALKEKRQNAFDDLFAIAEDLIGSKLTSPRHLGMQGGSNGGLLAGVALTQRPDLFNAILCQVPLLDMLRYHKLLAGASWVGEYGNPEIPEEAAYIRKYSPFQNLVAGKTYPEPFFTTSTRDDRVHPGHARRMVAKMKSLGLPVLYYENIEGGHAGASTLDSKAGLYALEYRYLWEKLK